MGRNEVQEEIKCRKGWGEIEQRRTKRVAAETAWEELNLLEL